MLYCSEGDTVYYRSNGAAVMICAMCDSFFLLSYYFPQEISELTRGSFHVDTITLIGCM